MDRNRPDFSSDDAVAARLQDAESMDLLMHAAVQRIKEAVMPPPSTCSPGQPTEDGDANILLKVLAALRTIPPMQAMVGKGPVVTAQTRTGAAP